jgi:hypothetical protein
MSRYKFTEFTIEIKAEKDIFGNTLSDWEKYGWLGYDKPLETYFLQLDKDADYPSVWYGTKWLEIRSPYILTALIEKLFGCEVNFNQEIIGALISERNESYEQGEIVDRLEEWDDRYREQTFTFQEEYIKAGFVEDIFAS